MTSEQKLWASIFDRPGSFVKKSFVTSQLAFHSDEDSTAWLKDRQHLFKVISGGTVLALAQSPGFSDFYGQHALQQEILSFLRAWSGPAHLGTHLGQFVRSITKEESKGRLGEFLNARPHLFKVHNHFVSLVEPSTDRELQQGHTTPKPQTGSHTSQKKLAVAIDDGKDTEDRMEEALVGFLSSLKRPAHLGQDVGPFLIERFGQSCRGQLGPFIKARQHVFMRDDMYISLAGRRPQRQAGPHVAQGKAVEPPPGFADRPAPSQNHSQRGANGMQASAAMAKGPQQQDATQQALDELREKYEDLQRNVEYIKAHLKLSTADMCPADGATSGRMQYPSTRPTSARIWVFGGHDGSDWMSDSRIFHIQKQEWRSVAELSSPLTFSAAASLHSHIYLFGGSSPATEDEGFTRSAQRFDVEEGQWRSITPMSRPRGNLAVSELGGAFFCVGGGTPTTQYDLAERYDPVSDRWTIVKPMGTRRFALASAALQGSMICVGGFDGQRHLASSELYDPRIGRWQELGSMSLPRGNFSACSVSDHELLAIGGYSNDDECTEQCEILDLRTTKWRPTGPLAQPRAFGAAVGSGQVYAIGGLGRDMSTYLEAVEVFDAQQQAWSELKLDAQQSLPFKRAFFAAVARG